MNILNIVSIIGIILILPMIIPIILSIPKLLRISIHKKKISNMPDKSDKINIDTMLHFLNVMKAIGSKQLKETELTNYKNVPEFALIKRNNFNDKEMSFLIYYSIFSKNFSIRLMISIIKTGYELKVISETLDKNEYINMLSNILIFNLILIDKILYENIYFDMEQSKRFKIMDTMVDIYFLILSEFTMFIYNTKSISIAIKNKTVENFSDRYNDLMEEFYETKPLEDLIKTEDMGDNILWKGAKLILSNSEFSMDIALITLIKMMYIESFLPVVFDTIKILKNY